MVSIHIIPILANEKMNVFSIFQSTLIMLYEVEVMVVHVCFIRWISWYWHNNSSRKVHPFATGFDRKCLVDSVWY
jgi:hypothetical protein